LLTTTTLAIGSTLVHENRVHLHDGVENTQVREGLLLDLGVELAALVIDEEHDELEVRVVPLEVSDFLGEVLLKVLGMDGLPHWLFDSNAQVHGSLRELIDEFIDLIVGCLIPVTEGGVHAGPMIEMNS
jgi:hypothetical protein